MSIKNITNILGGLCDSFLVFSVLFSFSDDVEAAIKAMLNGQQ